MKDKVIIIDQYNTTGNNNKNYLNLNHNKHKSLSKRINLMNNTGYNNNNIQNNSYYQCNQYNNKKDYEPKLKVY